MSTDIPTIELEDSEHIHSIDWSQSLKKPFWFFNDPVITHIVNTLSIGVVITEHAIIKTCQRLKKEIKDPTLRARVNRFGIEEMSHAKEHTRYNQALKQYGYPVKFLQKIVRNYYNIHFKFLSLKSRLALVVAAESMGAIGAKMSDNVFKYYKRDPKKPPLSLFIWHTIEEMAHADEAYLFYQQIGGGYIRRIFFLFYFAVATFSFYFFSVYLLLITDVYYGRIVKRRKFFKRLFTLIKRTRAWRTLFKGFYDLLNLDQIGLRTHWR